jgi:hypothetical protein
MVRLAAKKDTPGTHLALPARRAEHKGMLATQAEIARFVAEVTLDDYLADMRSELRELRGARGFRQYRGDEVALAGGELALA